MTLTTEKYISLETFRKDGTGVRTPVWFVPMGEELFFYTQADAGKVKRIRRNPRVRVAPCNIRGVVHGDWKEATARIAGQEESARAHDLLNKKYGWQKGLLNLVARFDGKARAVVALRVSSPA